MVTQGKKFLAAHNHPDPTEYYAPLAKSLSNTQCHLIVDPENDSLIPPPPPPLDGRGDGDVSNVVSGDLSSLSALRLRGSALTPPSADDLILDPLPDLKSRLSRNSYSTEPDRDMEMSPDMSSLSPNSDYSTGIVWMA